MKRKLNAKGKAKARRRAVLYAGAIVCGTAAALLTGWTNVEPATPNPLKETAITQIAPISVSRAVTLPVELPEISQPTFDVPLDSALQLHIVHTCENYAIDPAIVFAMIERESQYTADVIGDNGRSFGLMQIQKRWHLERMERLGVTDLLDPYQNVVVGIDVLAELIDRDKGLYWAIMAYNGGPSYANRMMAADTLSDYACYVIAASERIKQH